MCSFINCRVEEMKIKNEFQKFEMELKKREKVDIGRIFYIVDALYQ